MSIKLRIDITIRDTDHDKPWYDDSPGFHHQAEEFIIDNEFSTDDLALLKKEIQLYHDRLERFKEERYNFELGGSRYIGDLTIKPYEHVLDHLRCFIKGNKE